MASEKKYEVDIELFIDFIDESNDLLADMENNLLKLESAPDDKDLIGSVFRPIHSIKGNSPLFGLMATKKLAHKMEDILDLIRKDRIKPTKDIIDLLIRGTDELKAMLKRARDDKPEIGNKKYYDKILQETIDAGEGKFRDIDAFSIDLVNRLTDFKKNQIFSESSAINELDKIIFDVKKMFFQNYDQNKEDKNKDKEKKMPSSMQRLKSILNISVDKKNEQKYAEDVKNVLHELKGILKGQSSLEIIKKTEEDFDVCYNTMGYDPLIKEILSDGFKQLNAIGEWEIEKLDNEDIAKKNRCDNTKEDRTSGKTMRVHEESIDSFLSYVGELIVVKEMFGAIKNRISRIDSFNKINTEFRQVYELFSSLSQKMQKSIMKIRKVPLHHVLQKANRIVRDVSSNSKKDIDVNIKGDNIEVDKSLIEILDAPFIHMVRNAADHGIDAPDVRRKLGKPKKGTIDISVVESDDDIIMTVSDDGRGIDIDAIKAKGIKMGIIPEDKDCSDDEIVDLIFSSGVTTSKKATDVSGRGVGMDVAKRNIEKAGGRISVKTTKNHGSEFRIQLPGSVSTQILDGFVVSSNDNFYVIPLDRIKECFEVEAPAITSIKKNQEIIKRHGNVIPIVKLEKMFTHKMQSKNTKNKIIGITVEAKNKNIVLCVDEIVSSQQVVLRQMKGIETEKSGFAGAALLGDGNIAMIIDLENIIARVMG